MKYLKNMRHIYAERLFGFAIGMFVASLILDNAATSHTVFMAVYTVMSIAVLASVFLGVWVYLETSGSSNRFGSGEHKDPSK